MCGGRGTRLDAPVEKPLVDICGRPMLDRVAAALRESSAETVRAVTSPHTPNTRERAADLGLDPIEAPGDGYVSDLGFALDRVSRPVVTVVSDLPLVAPEHVDAVVSAADGGAATACVPVELKRDLGASVDDALVFDHEGTAVCPTGLGVVGPAAADATIDTDADTDTDTDTHSTMYLSTDTRLALNVNRPTDIELAEDRCE
ncbi:MULTISPECIES: NTP transferase domain-containing protein [unclassified Haloferax]|uniref:NTP transferase domain-containing protein n=1 Tax=unclassified Haloferax TaxID=2625095 RepID=UPI000E23F223|nr:MULTISPECIES: NTP transferase domain-containing protein [unclassified Haloferax]RDZ37087.1 GTP--adenosylcobinamide-phosphate guanylyltransferase [Haloferax sp. Atlit-24N]RLM37884.1 GTP--adenosylcobinamide-phosphate guanylyltransferase [Haloferax sp. Atlit-109R]RLM45829.1 GTP--adenosylcobinamide-phosphate guanylyltransferase [Haloferax sp. Atlit-105R]